MNKKQLKIFWTWYYVAERKGGDNIRPESKLDKDLREAFDNQWGLFWKKESHIRNKKRNAT